MINNLKFVAVVHNVKKDIGFRFYGFKLIGV